MGGRSMLIGTRYQSGDKGAHPVSTYIVCFEVASSDKRNALTAALKAYGFYCPINGSAWAVKTEESAVAIRDKLSLAIGASDRIFVIRSGTEAAWRNSYGPKNDEWLKEHL